MFGKMDDVIVSIDDYRGRRESLQKSKMQLSPLRHGLRAGGKAAMPNFKPPCEDQKMQKEQQSLALH